jgi:F-type H+-transporting ATPase subunit b
MDPLIAIFSQLGLDSTFFAQLIISAVVILLSQILVFNYLKDIIDLRESKTTKLEREAELKLKAANNYLQDYQKLIDLQYQKTNRILDSKKQEFLNNESQNLINLQSKLNKDNKELKEKFKEELKMKSDLLKDEVADLSKFLVNKITQ